MKTQRLKYFLDDDFLYRSFRILAFLGYSFLSRLYRVLAVLGYGSRYRDLLKNSAAYFEAESSCLGILMTGTLNRDPTKSSYKYSQRDPKWGNHTCKSIKIATYDFPRPSK